MSININNLNNNTQIPQKTVSQQSAQESSTNAPIKTVNQDSVSITTQAKQLNELQKKATDAPVMNQKKIDDLKKAINEGDYKINPEKLAASIATFEFELV